MAAAEVRTNWSFEFEKNLKSVLKTCGLAVVSMCFADTHSVCVFTEVMFAVALASCW